MDDAASLSGDTMRAASLVICTLGLAILTGCPSASTMALARPLKQGAMEIMVAPETLVLGGVALPQGEFGVRYGVTDSFEMGFKAWLIGAALEAKIGLMRAESMQSGIDVSFYPGVSFLTLGAGIGSGTSVGGSTLTLNLPVLIGINMNGHQLVLGPRIMDLISSGTVNLGDGTTSTGIVNNVLVGTSVGFAFKLSDSFRILPEISMLYPAFSTSASGTSVNPFGNTFLIQAGLGLLFGGKYE
jgi:hypothetical protein